MGIDIYMKWKGMTQAEKEAQYTGFATGMGHVGYLREAYHGGPYATRFFVREAFNESKHCKAKIPAKILMKRLPETLRLAKKRAKEVYEDDIDENSPRCMAFINFVHLAEEKEKETGEPVTIIASC